MDPNPVPLMYDENQNQSQSCNLHFLKIPPLKLSFCFRSFVGKIDNKNNNKAMCTPAARPPTSYPQLHAIKQIIFLHTRLSILKTFSTQDKNL